MKLLIRKIYWFIKRWYLQLKLGIPVGGHGEYCACSKWELYAGMGCPNPARPLKIII